jgi:RNA 3'-terminal phosphate cyclase (ATP)
MISLDGSQGEGGGQILRSALALSLCTGVPFRIDNIRAGRPRPGLMRQHLTAVLAATQVGNAETTGAAVGSRSLTFTPGKPRAGDYTFSVGTAGSATLVLQTVLPALVSADGPSQLVIEGGTHNPASPPFDFLDRTFLPLLARMGPRVHAKLERSGFYPAGGGRIRVSIAPSRLIPLWSGGFPVPAGWSPVAPSPVHRSRQVGSTGTTRALRMPQVTTHAAHDHKPGGAGD